MQIKLMVDGADQRIRITPDTRSEQDQKLLEYIMEWSVGRIKVNKETYRDNVKSVDLVLGNISQQFEEDGSVKERDVLFPLSN